MYIGIDLGTSGVKVVLLDEDQHIRATSHRALTVSRPQAHWAEQNPQDWWNATQQAIDELAQTHHLQDVKAIGLTGQMHGATLLDKHDNILTPAILWNDGRSQQECVDLEQAIHNSRQITGNIMMPGFTAPKLKWIAKHQPAIFNQISKILLPKDYLRLQLSGEYASDMSDASGTMWLDVANRAWSETMLNACELDLHQMPHLFEGNQITGYLRPSLAKRWKMPCVPIVAGGGDNAAGAVGIGLHQAGQAMLSLGTSGVYFVVTNHFQDNPQQAVHSFCHALPHRWHLMSVMLSAASAIDWATKALGIANVQTFFNIVEQQKSHTDLLFLPYLSGERTPHNNPNAKGIFWGLTHNDNQQTMAQAVIEGVSFALTECIQVLENTGVKTEQITLVGGGAKSPYWRQLLATITGKTFEYRQGSEIGPALGAAKLAQLGANPNQSIQEVCQPMKLEAVYSPNLAKQQSYLEKQKRFAQLYQRLKDF